MRRTALALALVAAALCSVPASAADVDLQKALAALAAAQSPKERLEQVRALLAIQGKSAARVLARLIRDDPSVDVRVGAARALGLIRAENALDLLVERLRRGGPRAVREELAYAARRREGGRAALLARLERKRTDRLEKGLVLRALAVFEDADTRQVLLTHARGEDDYLRGEALRALVDRKDERTKLVTLLTRLLVESRGVDRVVPVLDAAEGALHASMRAPLMRLQGAKERPIREAADHLVVALKKMESRIEHGKEGVDPKDRYGDGRGGRPRRETAGLPHRRPRFDLVFALDATGSTWATLPEIRHRILRETELLAHLDSSVRVGIIVYRGGRSAARGSQAFQLLAPTHDLERVRNFLRHLKSGGVDDRGARVAEALGDALGRIGWRWDAKRSVRLYADSGCEDAKRARNTVGIHFDADRTKTHVVYVLRTRTKVPPEYFDIARLGGTETPHVMD